jgi:hypothetical protein
MGYSFTKAAGDVLDTFKGEYEMSNTWHYKGFDYFWEHGPEHADGRITGTVWKFVTPTAVIRVGSFRIDADGRIARAPYGLRAHLHPVPIDEAPLIRYTFTVV